MSDKFSKKHGQKTAPVRTLKEKRADKKAKADERAHSDVLDAVHTKKH
ncbi:hypothetical protein SAMN04489806_1241 [Paramicrobacterium humi]|uniref:Uncharacterized protein n=1 Tax=Paramicrobacterium humi TaxID=640635 RepID=A0A1H4KPN5_9MICO|nr:hypothetical protein [Microbacterium humi]SEB60058.1 hypothetical protein SAMN04489806_1241 [Microbacterium humi]